MRSRLLQPLLIVLVLGLAGAVFAPLARAEEAASLTMTVPQSPKDVPRIKPGELKALLDRGADVEILDTQPPQGFAAMHIPMVFNMPWAVEIKSAMSLPKDKWVVIYCGSDREQDSSDVAFQLISRFGYRRVMVLEGGIGAWKQLDLPVESSFWD